MDLFQYPWNFPDNSVDEFQAHHIVEHIPHEPKPGMIIDPYATARWDELKNYDGFFCFFGEIWRIGVNGAKVSIITPFAHTHGAMQDPTHTRYMVPQSFAYLTEEIKSSPDFEYNTPCLFTVKACKFDIPRYLVNKEDEFTMQLSHFWNVTENMYVELEIIK